MWHKIIKTVFPYMPNTIRTRREASKRLDAYAGFGMPFPIISRFGTGKSSSATAPRDIRTTLLDRPGVNATTLNRMTDFLPFMRVAVQNSCETMRAQADFRADDFRTTNGQDPSSVPNSGQSVAESSSRGRCQLSIARWSFAFAGLGVLKCFERAGPKLSTDAVDCSQRTAEMQSGAELKFYGRFLRSANFLTQNCAVCGRPCKAASIGCF